MCGERQVEEDSDCLIPRTVQPCQLRTKKIIETGGVETAGIDSVEIDDNIWITEEKLLVERVNLSYEDCSFHRNINIH